MAEYDLSRELRNTIAQYKMLSRMIESDPLAVRLIHELVAVLEEQLRETEYPLAPKQQGND
jgi:hypothetical protein